ncbi:MAG TPA: hypothetical protein VK461_04975 [Acidimicrobiales bacterium]|nr:hypothetical protein [Acidimicrobiales bacterium]
MNEEVLRGGVVNPSVVRVGDTVRRTPSAATPAVHDLLRHLEAKGSDGAPRALDFDDPGREVLSYVEGTVLLDDAYRLGLRDPCEPDLRRLVCGLRDGAAAKRRSLPGRRLRRAA